MNKNIYWYFVYATILVIAFVLGINRNLSFSVFETVWSNKDNPLAYQPQYLPVNGKEIVMVYIGSSECGFANKAEMPNVIENIKIALQEKAIENGFGFSTIGISIDWNTRNGIQHLAKLGNFDEIMTGRKWQSIAANYFIWQEFPGHAVTPQIIVIMRTLNAPTVENSAQAWHISVDKIIIHKIGFSPIADWMRQDLPLPTDLIQL